MLNKYIFLLSFFGLIGMIGLGGSYTAPAYNAIDFNLCSGYTAPAYNNITFTLGESESCIIDTCSCAGLNTNWEIDMADFCVISDNCNLGTGTLSFINAGNLTVNAVINTAKMGKPSVNSILWMGSTGRINVG